MRADLIIISELLARDHRIILVCWPWAPSSWRERDYRRRACEQMTRYTESSKKG